MFAVENDTASTTQMDPNIFLIRLQKSKHTQNIFPQLFLVLDQQLDETFDKQ